MQLSQQEISRYSRHLILPEVGMEGQLKLKQAKVLCVGTGGLGSPLAMYLAAAGVGTIGLVDSDTVDVSNLQRQLLHHTNDVGRSKIQSAKEKLNGINPNVEVFMHDTFLTADNAMELCSFYDVIADGTDNFQTRYLVNDACVLLGKPNVHASIFRFEGQASVFDAKSGPCYRCLYPEPPPPGEIPSCAEGGVLGVLPGMLGVIQATEVIKQILGIGNPLVGRLFTFDALEMRARELRLRKNPNCPACGEAATLKDLGSFDYNVFCGISEDAVQHAQVSPVELLSVIQAGSQGTLLDVRDYHEWDICRIDGAIHIPLAELPQRMSELDKSKPVHVYCLMGGRSRKAQNALIEAGFADVINVEGGIRAWAKQVDPEMPIY
jgi:molybdopterin/thiamine biosynthesis adenylyltransferase/rhodanese-related sulfurtransferase